MPSEGSTLKDPPTKPRCGHEKTHSSQGAIYCSAGVMWELINFCEVYYTIYKMGIILFLQGAVLR